MNFISCLETKSLVMVELVLLKSVQNSIFLFLYFSQPKLFLFLQTFKSLFPTYQLSAQPLVLLLQKSHTNKLLFNMSLHFLDFSLKFSFFNVITSQELFQLPFTSLPLPPFFRFFRLCSTCSSTKLLIDCLQFLVLFFQAEVFILSFLIFLLSNS